MNTNINSATIPVPFTIAYLHGTTAHGHVIRISPCIRVATHRLPLAVLSRNGIVRVVDGTVIVDATLYEQTTYHTQFQIKNKQKKSEEIHSKHL